jgi:hypothetical protein
MRFNDIPTRVARAALTITDPQRHAEPFVENLLSCHRDGDLAGRLRFLSLLAEDVLPERGALEDLAFLLQDREKRRNVSAARLTAIRPRRETVRLSNEPFPLSPGP